jgi:hypothetical protein
MHHLSKPLAALCGLTLLATTSLRAADLPDPDGKPADMSKPVQVFLIWVKNTPSSSTTPASRPFVRMSATSR